MTAHASRALHLWDEGETRLVFHGLAGDADDCAVLAIQIGVSDDERRELRLDLADYEALLAYLNEHTERLKAGGDS